MKPRNFSVVDGRELDPVAAARAGQPRERLPGFEIAKPLEREDEQCYARELREARQAFADGILGLPDELRAQLLNGDVAGPTRGYRWRLGKLDACYERLRGVPRKTVPSDETRGRISELKRVKRRIDQARDALIVTNLGFVGHIARQFDCEPLPFADLVQEGNIGLIRAVDKFDPERGHRFTTYAYWWIRQAISRAISDKSHMIRIPDHAADLLRKLRRAQRELRETLDREPLPRELAAATGATREQVLQLLTAIRAPQPLEDHGPDGDRSGLVSRLADPQATNPLAGTFQRELKEQIQKALRLLDPRERKILRLRFGLGREGRMTLEQIGAMFNLTRERIRQIEASALKKIHAARDSHDLERHLVAS